MTRSAVFTDDFSGDLSAWTQTNAWASGNCTISGGVLRGVGTGLANWAHIVRSAGTYGNDQYCKATIGSLAFNDTNYGGVVCVNDSGDVSTSGAQCDYYGAVVYDDASSGSAHTCALVKVLNGSPATLGATASITYSSGDTVEIESHDNGDSTVTLTFFKNGVAQFTRDDTSSVLTGGRPSLGLSVNTTVSFDDAEGGNVTTSSADQEGVTYGADDGNEASHTLGTQDAALTGATVGDKIIARFLIDATGDPASASYSLRYNKNGGAFGLVPVGATAPDTLAQPTWGAAGTAGSGTTSCTPAYPTGITAATSKLFCVVTGRSNTASTVPTMPAGWTHVGGLEGGTGTWGVDTGPRRVDFFQKDTVTGSESGTVTVSLAGTTANTLRATIFRVEVASGAEIDVELSTGADTSNDTSYSATGSTNLTLDANRLLIIATAQNIDTGTATSRAISASGITFGTLTNRADTAVTNGNDHRHIINTVPVSSGSGTVAPTFSYTISANGSGPTAFLSLRSRIPGTANEVFIADSTNVGAGGTATTARMTPPDGKTSGNFVAGRLLDDANSYTLDIGADQYTELGFVVDTQAPLVADDSVKFRIYKDGVALNGYSSEPQWLFGELPIAGTLAATESAGDTAALSGPGAIPAWLYYVIYPTATGTEPTDDATGKAHIKAGEDGAGVTAVASGDEVAPTTDTDPFDFAQASGLTASTAYKASYVWSYGDAASDSNVVTTAEFTTEAGTGTATGTIAATEAAGDSAALLGNLVAGTAAAATETAGDTAALSGELTASVAIAVTETTGDTAALPAALLVSAALAATEATSDSAAIVGGRVNIGAIAATESGGDAAAVVGNAVAGASIAAQESGADAASLAGKAITLAALAAAEAAADTASIAGAALVLAAITATETGVDTAQVIATEADVALGAIVATESGFDSAAVAAKLIAGAGVAVTEPASDSAAISGAIVVSGVVAVTEAGDLALVDGKVLVLAALAVTEGSRDSAAIAAGRQSFAVIAAAEAAADTAAIDVSVSDVIPASLAAPRSRRQLQTSARSIQTTAARPRQISTARR